MRYVYLFVSRITSYESNCNPCKKNNLDTSFRNSKTITLLPGFLIIKLGLNPSMRDCLTSAPIEPLSLSNQ